MNILVTGGAGFIGSHTCLRLLEEGHQVVSIDNYSNSTVQSLTRIKELTSSVNTQNLKIIDGDIRRSVDLFKAFNCLDGKEIDAVIHFAGLKSVGESMKKPLKYWDINVNGTSNLLMAMSKHGCKTLVFSSSCTVYGTSKQKKINEASTIAPINPYGRTKAAVEQMLLDQFNSDPQWRICCLRYFNPVGAHPSGHIGEDPKGTPGNLFPFLMQVAKKQRKKLNIFGNDWPTADGTCIRDYIHILDLVDGHLAALRFLCEEAPQWLAVNLGTGIGVSVLEFVSAFEQATGLVVPYEFVERRAGDAAVAVADPSVALKKLKWKPVRSLRDICIDGWKWQNANPNGFNNQASIIS